MRRWRRTRINWLTLAAIVLAVVGIIVVGIWGFGIAIAIGLMRYLARGLRGG